MLHAQEQAACRTWPDRLIITVSISGMVMQGNMMQESMMGLVEGPVASGADPVASACFRLGWRMEELFSQFEVPDRPPRAYDLAHLCGLTGSAWDWTRWTSWSAR
jgi:hypothetical protein